MCSPVLPLQADALGLDAEDVGQPLADRLAMRQQLGPLGEDDAVDVDDPPAERGDGVQGGAQHFGRVAAAVLGIGVGKHLPDVAQGGGPQQGVGHGVQERVGVAVADRLAVVRDVDAAQPQRPAGPETVRVVSESDADSDRGRFSHESEGARHYSVVPPGKQNRDDFYVAQAFTPQSRRRQIPVFVGPFRGLLQSRRP